MRRIGFLAMTVTVLGLWTASAQADEGTPVVLSAARAVSSPLIDGSLEDEIWGHQPLPLGEWLSYNPLHGDRIPQRTRVWAAYDDRYLYFAFDCQDPEPTRIKTSVTRRDNIWQDDWVGVSIDTLGTGQVAYHMMVNPSGVQLDMLNSISGGEDQAPDWIWDSAARLTETGYAVEIRVPLQSIRFARGADVRTGILFWRRVSRLGVSVSWPALEPGKWVFQKHAALMFERLDAPLTRELIPATTYVFNEARETPDRWTQSANKGDIGFSSRVGLTSNVILDATVNPDFSQVESDSFQVEVNQRFPIFFSEKRPFFMEGSDIFRLAGLGNGDASMVSAVHTRNIVDPLVGFKLTGSAGKVSFGTLNASDEAAGRDLEDGDPRSGRDRIFNIARARYSLGTDTFIGAIVTDTRFGGDRNSVAGADASWKFGGTSHQVTTTVLHSWTDDRDGPRSGTALQMNYNTSSKRSNFGAQLEHYDREFVMDTAFYNRVGFTQAWAYIDYSFYPDKDRYPWIRRITPFTFTQGGRDREAGNDDFLNVSGFRFNFTRQGFFRIDQFFGREPWAGRRFDIGRIRVQGSVQVFRWLAVEGYFHSGRAIFYDLAFGGRQRRSELELTFQPTGRLTQVIEHERVTFDRAETGERVYDVDVVNARTTYQFTRAFALRGIAQYDSSQTRVLTDFLASYELKPGTVIYGGYGALFEQRDFRDREWVAGEGSYRASRRGLFLKASYLYRF